MSTLQLTIPTQLDDASGASRVKPREVAKWLENLPFLDLQRTAPAIHQQLRLFNRMAMPPAQRIQILDAFRTAYARLRNSKPGAHQALNFNLESLCKRQCQDLAFGYKIAIQDLLAKKFSLGQKKPLGQAIGGAIDCLSHHVTYFFEAYQLTPRALWSEAVLLFRFAQEKGIDQNKIKTIDNESASLQHIFTSMALLRLADPYQFQPGAVWKLRRYLDHHSEKAHLFDSSSMESDRQARLVVDNSDDVKSHVLLVSVSKLMQQIHQDLDLLAQPKKPVIAGFPVEMSRHEISHPLRRVIATWERMLERKTSLLSAMDDRSNRKSDRTAIHQKLELVASVSGIWYALNNLRPFDPQMFDQKHSDEIDLSLNQGTTPQRQVRQHNIASCSTINRSAGGVALRADILEGMVVHVGQLVALHRSETDSDAWILAVCRWLIERNGSNVDIGLQYLTKDAKPIAIRNRLGEMTNAGVIPAFAANQSNRSILVTQPGIFREDGRMEIYDKQGRMSSVRCGKLLEACTGYERFTYQVEETD